MTLIERAKQREDRLRVLADDPYAGGTELSDADLLRDLQAHLADHVQERERLKELARKEHDLLMSIVRRLKEIGQIGDHDDTNVTGAIHGVIDGFVTWRSVAKTAESQLSAADARIASLSAALVKLRDEMQATEFDSDPECNQVEVDRAITKWVAILADLVKKEHQ